MIEQKNYTMRMFIMDKCTPREIYEKIYREHKLYQEVVNGEGEDKASRLANIFAVENTRKMWKLQYKKED